MKNITIDFNVAFEKTLANLLALPESHNDRVLDETVVEALRSLYAAAHGRVVETSIGAVTIVPATNPNLKETAWLLNSRSELLDLLQHRTGPRGGSMNSEAGSSRLHFVSGQLNVPGRWPMPAMRRPEFEETLTLMN